MELLKFTGFQRFHAEFDWDNDHLYPHIIDATIRNVQIVFNPLDIPYENIQTRIESAFLLMMNEYNYINSFGQPWEFVGKSTKVLLGVLRVVRMSPWQWWSYMTDFFMSIPFLAGKSVDV